MSLLAMIAKENLVLLRSRRARGLLLGYLCVLGFVLLWSWPRGPVLTLAALASKRMVYMIGLGQLVLLLAAIPGLTASAIVHERQTGALELLQVSRLSPLSILLGKWLGCALFALLLLFCSIPLVMLCFLIGTLEGGLVRSIYLHLVMTVLWAGMIGLGVSCLTRTVYSALMTTYLVILAWNVLPVLASLFLRAPVAELLRDVSPMGAMVSLSLPDAWLRVGASAVSHDPMMVFGGFCFATILLAGVTTYLQLSRPYQPRSYRRDRLIEEESKLISLRRLRFPFYLIDPGRRRRPIADWINPVFAKEVRSRALGHGTTFLRAFYTVLVLSLMFTIFSVVQTSSEIVDSVRVVVIATQVVLIGLLTPPLTAPAISSERERGTLDVLRLTRVGPLQLVMGKWCFALLVSTCILVAAVPMWYVIFQMQRVPPSALFKAIAVVLASLLSGTLGGLFASALCRRSSVAVGVGYVVTLGVLFGTLLPVALFRSLPDQTTNYLLSLNPVAAAVRAVSLSLFRGLLPESAWKIATGFLLTSAAVFLAGTLFLTRRLLRTRA